MKTKEKSVVIASIFLSVLILISILIMLFFLKFDTNFTITVSNFAKNETEVIKVSDNRKLSDILKNEEIDGFEFLGWYYSGNINKPVDLSLNAKKNENYVALYSKVINKEQLDEPFEYVTIKSENDILSSDEIKKLKNKKYVDLSNIDIEENVLKKATFFNSKLVKIKLPKNLINIEDECFKNSYNLIEVSNIENVRILGDQVFYNCQKLEGLNLNSIVSIGKSAFSSVNCNIKLSEDFENFLDTSFFGFSGKIELPESNSHFILDNDILYSSDYTKLYKCFSQKDSVIINDSTTHIMPYAFYLSGVKSVDAKSIENIAESAFEKSELEEINFNNSNLLYIGKNAFKETLNLKNIVIPASIKNISVSAFESSFIKSINLEDTSLTIIEDRAFKNCNNLKSITIPQTITNIPTGLFENCQNLESVTIKSSDITIGNYAFYNCSKLLNLVFSGRNAIVGDYSFAGCKKLSSVECLFEASKLGIGAFKNCESIAYAYFNNITTLNEETFCNCASLRAVDFNNLASLKADVFSKCYELKNFIVPSTLKEFDELAFVDSGLEKIESRSEEFIGQDGVLYNNQKNAIICYPICKNDASFTIEAEILKIESIGFYLNTNLSSIKVDDNSTAFKSVNDVLYNFDNSKIIKYPNAKITSSFSTGEANEIGKMAFSNNQYLESLEIEENVSEISMGALSNMQKLKSLKVAFIGKNSENLYPISYFFGLKDYNANSSVPKTLTKVEVTKQSRIVDNCFYGCDNITSITIYNANLVGKYAFSNMQSLTELYFKDFVSEIDERAISSVKSLVRLGLYYSDDLSLSTEAFYDIPHSLTIRVYSAEFSMSELNRVKLKTKFVNCFAPASSWLYLEWVG